MPTDRVNDPVAILAFLEAKLAAAPPDFTLDDALAQWEAENGEGDDREETLRAIREGLADVKAGRTSDALEFLERMRRKVRSLRPS